MPSAPAIRLELRRSRLRRRCEGALVALTALGLALAPWPIEWRFVALAVFALAVAVAHVLGSRRPAPAAVEWRSDGRWFLDVGDEALPARHRSTRIVGPLIALDFDAAGGRHRIALWPDSADPDALRRLRIRLARAAGDDGDSPDGRAVG